VVAQGGNSLKFTTQVQRQVGTIKAVPGFSTAISLHSHTYYSKENLDFLPHYIDHHQIPIVSQLVRGELKRYQERTGKTIDFRQAYWTPPMSASFVLGSEKQQIEEKLGLTAVVSITDHDSIGAPLELREKAGLGATPISVEWSIPFAGNVFHLGIHQLPAAQAPDLMRQMEQYTAQPSEPLLHELLCLLDSFPETLIILNHPFCNFVRVQAGLHRNSLREFLEGCRGWLHAVELNGMRPWAENQMVPGLAEEYDLPIVAGGDRHGSRPNTMLNLTQAKTLSEFSDDIRKSRGNHVVVLPAYEEPVCMRELATASDVVRRYPNNPPGTRRLTDRVFANVAGFSWHPLSFYWDGGNGCPRWLAPVLRAVAALGSDNGRKVLRTLLMLSGEYDRAKSSVREYGSEAGTEHMGCYPRGM
jgi:hypothetical protein